MAISDPTLARAARAFLILAVSVTLAAGEEPSSVRIFTASDIAGLVGGVDLPTSGAYTVHVWAPPGVWSLKADGPTLTLTSLPEGKDAAPAWRQVGKVEYDPKARFRLRVVGPKVEPRPVQPKKNAAKAVPPAPVPAFLAFTRTPDADLNTAIDLFRGRLDAIDPSPDSRRTASRTLDEGAGFVPPSTRREWLDRSEHLRNQILVSLGLWPMPPKTELRPQVYGKLERDGYTIEKVTLETLPGYTLSGNLYRPKGRPGRLPLVLSPHGHYADGRFNPDVQARCIWWAKRMGCIVFMYDMVGYNDSKPFGHAFLNDRLRRWGLSLPTLQTWNSIRALDWATTLPDVDPARVGCTGESGGGTQTFLLTAIEPRIKVVAPVVMVSHKMQGGCLCENCAGLRIGTDNLEIAALAAPRPLKIVGADDWTDETMTVEYPALQQVYALMGTPERVSADKFNFPHNYNKTSREAVYAFMGRWLAGIDDPAAFREGELKIETPDDLRTFDRDHPSPPSFKSADALEASLIDVAARSLDKLAPTTAAAPWEAARGLLREALTVRVGVSDPAPFELVVREVRRSARDGISIVHREVGRASDAARVPVVLLAPGSPNGRATVVFTARGKSGLVRPDGTPSALTKALLERGQSVIGFDPLFIGEAIDPRVPATARPSGNHFETYNPSLPADRTQDLATVLAWARSRPDWREVSLIALGDAGPIALVARPLLPGIARTAIDLGGFEYGDGSGTVSPGLDLPGVLQFGGLRAAAALAAPDPLWISGAPSAFPRAWPIKAYSLADASGNIRIEEAVADPSMLAKWIDCGE